MQLENSLTTISHDMHMDRAVVIWVDNNCNPRKSITVGMVAETQSLGFINLMEDYQCAGTQTP